MNPQDLLYTNKFVGTNNININKNQTNTKDRLNVLKTIDQPFPKKLNRNWQPILSDEVSDIVKDKYKKRKVTSLLIDSKDRNIREYPYPNNYKIILGRQFNYVESINLKFFRLQYMPITNTKISWTSSDLSEYNVSIPQAEYTNKIIGNIIQSTMNSVINNDGTLNNFYVQIDSELNEIYIINRKNVLDILSVQTIFNKVDDVYGGNVNSNYGIYILLNKELDINIGVPLIPTNIPDIGGYISELFNFKEFYYQSIEQNSYNFVDIVTINGKSYYRYILIPKTIDGNIIYATLSQNIILSQGLKDIINFDKTYFTGIYNNGIVQIGYGCEFSINFNESTLFTKVFNWYECNNEMRYIFTNKSDYNLYNTSCFNKIRLGLYDNWLYRDDEYILLKLNMPFKAPDLLGNNLIKTQNSSQDNVADNNLFAMIDLMKYPYEFYSNILKFYDAPLEKLNELIIEFVDKNGYTIDLKCNHIIILEIVEYIDVLKDTLIDSRHGEVNTTGYN